MKNSLSVKDTPVTIGEVSIPLETIYSSEYLTNGFIEVVLTAKLRKIQVVGTIKAIIAFSNPKFETLNDAVNMAMSQHKDIYKDFDESVSVNCLYF